MTIRKTMTAVLALCGLMVSAGCFNPAAEKYDAKKAMKAGDYPAATQKLHGVLERDPSDWEAHYLLGMTYLEQGRPIRAQSELEQAFAVKDRSSTYTPKILDAIAESLYQQKQFEALYAFLGAQIERYETWQDYARKARFLAKADDVDGAALAYRQAAYFSRNEDEAIYVEIADFYEQRGDYDKALQALKWAYYINDERLDLPNRFRQLGVVPGPTTKEPPPEPAYAGARLFDLPKLIAD